MKLGIALSTFILKLLKLLTLTKLLKLPNKITSQSAFPNFLSKGV